MRMVEPNNVNHVNILAYYVLLVLLHVFHAEGKIDWVLQNVYVNSDTMIIVQLKLVKVLNYYKTKYIHDI